jgi:RNA polymerase primary sigma factor
MLNKYAREVNKFTLISENEEKELSLIIQSNNVEQKERAKQRLIEGNLRLVIKIAHDFRGRGMALGDIISEGNQGLIHAANRFDSHKGSKFSSYAALWVKAYIRRAFLDKSRVVRIPVETSQRFARMKLVIDEMTEKLGRKPTIEEIAKKCNLNKKQIKKLTLLLDHGIVSLQSEVKEGEESQIGDLISDEKTKTPFDIYRSEDDKKMVINLLSKLTEREKTIIIHRFGLFNQEIKTLDEVALLVNCTKERVRQLQRDSLKKMNSFVNRFM